MERHLKVLLKNLRPRETVELVADHVKRVEVNAKARIATLHVDKRYAFNAMIAHDHLAPLLTGVKKAFGAGCGTIVKLAAANFPSESERIVLHPHAVQFR